MNSNGCEAERQGQTTGEIEQLDKVLSVLSESVLNLTDRLCKAMRNPTPSGVVGEDNPDEELVSLARSIRDLRYRVSDTHNNIQDILNRLEL